MAEVVLTFTYLHQWTNIKLFAAEQKLKPARNGKNLLNVNTNNPVCKYLFANWTRLLYTVFNGEGLAQAGKTKAEGEKMKTLIETTETTISVRGEYNSEFVTGARRLAGKWKAPYWVFDIRNEDAVRELCMTCYGTDGRTTDLVDVRITIPEDGRVVGGGKGPIELFGRTLARAFGRDSGAKLGDGVVVEKGGFSSGGSMKNWSTTVKDGTVVVLRDVSRRLVERHDDDAFIVEIIGGQNTVDREALISEREKLVARLAEIDEILAN